MLNHDEEIQDEDVAYRTISDFNVMATYKILRGYPATSRAKKYVMTQDGQQSANKKLAKLHAHLMMTQLNIRQGIKQFDKKGNEALLKELSQLHKREALLPLRQEDMSQKQRKKALRYLMFLNKNVTGESKQEDALMVGCKESTQQKQIQARGQYH